MSEDPGTRRRQARGRARIELILQAAATVFGELGYEAATTNAIAARAGISPGSLYQFFANKDEVGRALAETYAGRLAEVDLLDDLSTETLDEALSNALARIVDFNVEHPGFKALFARTDMPPSMRDAVAPAHDAIQTRVRDAMRAIFPGADDRRTATMATVILSMVKGLMPLIVAESDPEQRRLLVAELHRGILAYVNSARGDADADASPVG